METGRYSSDVKETLLATMATYSKTPVTETMEKAKQWHERRNAVPLDPIMQDRWLEKAQNDGGRI